ncbi:MAG: carboxypeptidase-like regulatory domain-containing protein [Chitinophagaceae bacterium]
MKNKRLQWKLLLPLFLFASVFSYAQNNISGRITDTSGHPLQGVSVIIKGTSR